MIYNKGHGKIERTHRNGVSNSLVLSTASIAWDLVLVIIIFEW